MKKINKTLILIALLFTCSFSDAKNGNGRETTLKGGKVNIEVSPKRATLTNELPVSAGFIEYIKAAANPEKHGQGKDGRFYPYPAPGGWRIGYGQPVSEKRFHQDGVTAADAECTLVARLQAVAAELRERLRRESQEFDTLPEASREILLDYGFTEGVAKLKPEWIQAVTQLDWGRILNPDFYVRYDADWPDSVRNKAFFERWSSKAPISNQTYEIQPAADGSLEIKAGQEMSTRLVPSFTVMVSEGDPSYHRNHSNYLLAPRTSLRWEKYNQPLEELNLWLKEMGLAVLVTEDAKGKRTWNYGGGKMILTDQYAQGTTNPFLAGERCDLIPSHTVMEGRTIHWKFAPNPRFAFSASLTLPEGNGDPEISYQLSATKPGFYSVAFTGAPGVKEGNPVPQMASGRGGRQFNHVVAEVTEKLPRVQVSDGRQNFLLVVHPESIPFTDQLIDFSTSRFGTMLRKENGVLTPVVFAPVMGATSSKMRAGESRAFKLLFVMRAEEWQSALRYVAEDIYGVRDQRDNSGSGSLSAAIARVRDYLADRNGKNYAMWHAEQKYYDYWSDQSGLFKPFSPLFGLSAAVVLDDEDFYRQRALPAVEFAISRASNVFAPYDLNDNTGQVSKPSRQLGRPYVSLPQLVSLWEFYQRRTQAFHLYAEQSPPSGGINDLLAAWKLSGDGAQLELAKAAGEKDLKSETGGGYMDFLELYEATGDKRFLGAAQARIYTQIATGVNLFPKVPEKEIIYDKGGKVPVHAHAFGRNKRWGFPPPVGLNTFEIKAPAWRGSEIGLESFSHHRAELWLNHPPQILRIASCSGDRFLQTVARWGVVGRYANYAGDNRTERSLITEKPDAPEHPIWKLTYSSINPGHAWEFIGAMLDFRVTDCFDRSARQIAFPGLTMAGSPFRVHAYGAEPGRFYGEENAHLWCPPDLLNIDNQQIEWLAAWGNGKLYLAFWSQSFREEQVSVQINPKRAVIAMRAQLLSWENNQPRPAGTTSGQRMEFKIPAKGITAFIIDQAQVKRTLQAKIFDPAAPKLGPESIKSLDTPFGKVNAMLLSMGRGLTNAFVYTEALPESVIAARLRYRQGNGEWKTLQDEIFPFEFSVWLDEQAGDFEGVMEVETRQREKLESPLIGLRK